MVIEVSFLPQKLPCYGQYFNKSLVGKYARTLVENGKRNMEEVTYANSQVLQNRWRASRTPFFGSAHTEI